VATSVGFIVVYNGIPALIAQVDANARSAPKRVADRIAARARQYAPVASGALRGSIESVSVDKGYSADVEVHAEYAAYVEYGTYKMAPQPFLTPAVEDYEREFALEVLAPLFT
jgi:HK97 gp10 family phage protein